MSKINIYQGQVPNTATELFTATQATAIHAAAVCNTSGAAVTLEIWLAYDGAASGDANKIYDALSVDADSEASLALLVNHAIPTGGKLYAAASAATSLTMTVSGVQ